MSDAIEPTPELSQHHNLREPETSKKTRREFWQINTRFAALPLSEAERAAGHRWRKDWDTGVEGGSTSGAWGVKVDNSDSKGAMDYRVDALGRLRLVTLALGKAEVTFLALCIAYDTPWTQVGKACRIGDRTAIRRTINAIKSLADFYETYDKLT